MNAKLKELIKLNERRLKVHKRQVAITQQARDKAQARVDKANRALTDAKLEADAAARDFTNLRLENNTARGDVYHLERLLMQLEELRKAK